MRPRTDDRAGGSSEPGSPVVAHCASPFLELTTGWIHDQVRVLRRYRPIVLTQAEHNRELFPFEPVFDMSGRGPVRFARRVARRLRGTYAGYEGVLRRENAALIHAHFGQEGWRCLCGKRRADLPMVTTFYGLDVSMLPRRAEWRSRFARLFREGERFLAEGPHMAGCLVDIGCPQEKVRVQRLGVDLAKFPFRPEMPRGGDEAVVLMYSSLREKKGHLYGFRAFARMADSHPGARVEVIGDGPLRDTLVREANRLGIADRVVFRGVLPHADCIRMLSRSTVLLYPSVTASDGDTEGGAPVGLIEAMASGLPVVSTRHADIPNVVPEGWCGLLAEEKDVDGLAERLDAVLRDASLRERLAREARSHVENHHDLARQGEMLERVYDEVLGNGPLARAGIR